jgi:hypothetical protein
MDYIPSVVKGGIMAGSTRPSITYDRNSCSMDARVKPAHDQYQGSRVPAFAGTTKLHGAQDRSRDRES